MKRLHILFTLLAALIFGSATAWADIVENYTMGFNDEISTTDHDFKPAPGWGHVSHYYTFGGYWGENVYPTYTYCPTEGRDGSGTIKVSSQTKVTSTSYYGTGTTSDVLVTPMLTGASSIYVKKVSDEGTVKLFTVTYNASTKKYTKGSQITDFTLPELSTTEWTKVELPTADGVYYGICASDVYIDDFEAEQADIVLNKELKITKVNMTSGGSPDCDADNNVNYAFEITLKNTGDVNFAPGDEDYSLSIINYSNSNDVMATADISETLNVGEEKMITVSGTYPLSSLLYADKVTRARIDVKENISKTTSYGGWIEPTPYKPILVVRKDKIRQDNGVAYAWGKANSSQSKAFTIENTGAAPLNLKSISVPEGFSVDTEVPQTIAAHQSVDMNIAFDATTPGDYAGDVVISGDDLDDFIIKVSGTMLDPDKYYINFEEGKIPAGTYIESDWSIAETGMSGSGNSYFLKNSRTNADSKFVTPLLNIAEGEKLTLEAARCYYTSDYESSYLRVYYSDNRTDWTLAKQINSADMSGEREGVSGHYEGKLTSFEIDNIPAGNHYLAFGAGYVCLDNIYGFKLVDVAHDMKIGETKIAANGLVNNPYKASVSVDNINTKNEAADSYSATMYMNNVAVATAPAVEIEAGGSATFEFQMTPHEAGTYQTHVVFKSLSDDYELATSDVEVTIGEELASKDVAVGAETTTTTYAPFNWYNSDNTIGGDVDMIYKAELLTEYGLKAGDKITSIKYTGTAKTATQYKQLNLNAYVGMVSEESYQPTEKVDGLQQINVYEDKEYTIGIGDVVETAIQLTQPIEWDGESAIRIFTRVNDTQRKYVRIEYQADKRYNASYKNGSTLSFSSTTYLPVAVFGLKAEPKSISGTVKSTKGEPIADAAVKLTNGDVLYTGKTDTEGNYSINVIQTDKKYKFAATADKYVDYEDADSVEFASESIVKDIVMQRVTAKVSGSVTYRKAGVANATVALINGEDRIESTTDEQGAFVFDAVDSYQAYKLSVKADSFNDYTSAEDITITADTQLAAIELAKAPVKVSGKVTYHNVGIAGAKVFLNREGESLNATTNDEGNYTFDEVVPDYNYALSVKAEEYRDYTTADSIEVKENKELEAIEMTRAAVTAKGKVIYREAGLSGAEVKMKADDFECDATTDENGEFVIEGVETGKTYTICVNKDKFKDYTSEQAIEINDDIVLDDIVMTKYDIRISGVITWCGSPVKDIAVMCLDEDDVVESTVFTDEAGAYEFNGMAPDKKHVIMVSDPDGNFENDESDAIETDENVVKDFDLKAVPVEVTIGNSGYAAFSCNKAVDFSKTAGVKAYVVTEVTRGYTILKEITEAPANTGVILEAASGEYDIIPVLSATDVEKNMLVATTDEPFTISEAKVGKAWALDSSDGASVFSSKAGTVIAEGSAYLAADYSGEFIYLSEASGINSASAFSNGNLDESKPMFNVSGQRVSKNYKGVIIQNGKKYTVK